ncbi:MAG TPA: TonB family protein [Rhodocyclaceae bacterium]|nr:TonB family protein [Rhodocyclaceae bacterium]
MFQHRESVARLTTLLFGLGVAYVATHGQLRHDAPSAEKPIQLRLADIPPPDAPPKPEPPKPEVKKPPLPQPPAKTSPPQKPTPVVASPVATTSGPSPVQVPAAPVSPTATAIPEKPSVVANAGAEGRFAQDVRTRIEKRKVYPESAMALGMTGTVEVSYVLDRAGILQSATVVGSSGYPLLDQAALRAVRAATYSPMADDMWPREKQKEFRTKVVFSID